MVDTTTLPYTTPLVPSEEEDEVKIGHKYCGKSLAVLDTPLLHRTQSKIHLLSSSHLSSSSSVVSVARLSTS
mgnify:CR=1 FL=1